METRIIMTKEQFENNINCKMNYDELIYEEIQKYNCIHFDKRIVYTVKHTDEYRALMAV